jgi:hypothetical protein
MMSAAEFEPPGLRTLALELANDALSGRFDVDGILHRWGRVLLNPRPLTAVVVAMCSTTPQQRLLSLDTQSLQTWLLAHLTPELIQRARPRKGPRTPALESLEYPSPPLPGAPPALSVAALARLLGSDARELEWLSGRWSRPRGDASAHYVSRLQRKQLGGERLIEAPKSRLKSIQTHILKRILDRVPVSDDAHGFVRGRSALTHARLHVGAAQVLKLDLANWFLSIHYGRVQAQFLRMGFPLAVAGLLAELCTTTQNALLPCEPAARSLAPERHLPQGAPTSPGLANRVAARLDRRLHAFAAVAGWRYSRYADDLVFSSLEKDRASSLRAALPRLTSIIEDEGFRVRADKVALRGQHQQQKIGGIVVNERLNLDRRSFDLLKAQLHAFHLGREQRPDGMTREDLRQRLQGQLSWLRQLHPRRAARLERYLLPA